MHNHPQHKNVPAKYFPRQWARYAHAHFKRHNVLVVHRRGGKSVLCVNEIIDQALRFDKLDPLTGRPLMNPQYMYVATTFGQVEKIAWNYFKYYTEHIPGVKFNEKKLRLIIPHPTRGTITIHLVGAENFNALRGIYLDGYVLDEYGDMHPDVRDKVLFPTLTDRRGWEIIIGTPNGDNSFKKLYDLACDHPEMWFTFSLNVNQSKVIPEEELKVIRSTISRESYDQEYMLRWDVAPQGYYYIEQMMLAQTQGRITKVPYNPNYTVNTYWDLGIEDTNAIWFIQEVGRAIHVINYMEDHGKGLDYWASEVLRLPYKYDTHFLPHDVANRELTSAMPRIEYLALQGIENVYVVPKPNDKEEGIQSVRQVLPLCIFDAENCATGIKALREYKKKYDSKLNQYSNSPVHNWASNGADAFRQFAVTYEQGFGNKILQEMESGANLVEHNWDILNF